MKLTIAAAAAEFGVSRETIKRKLSACGIDTGDGITHSIREIHDALSGDLRAERVRIAKAEASKAERLNKIAESRLLDFTEIDKRLKTDLLLPLRDALLNLPAQAASLCNPGDPVIAERILDEQIARILATIRTQAMQSIDQPETTVANQPE